MKKKFLIITGILVLVLAVGGLWGYNNYFKPDPVIREQLNDQFGADFFKPFGDGKVDNNSGTVNNPTSNSDVNPGGDPTKKLDTPANGLTPEEVKQQEESKIVTDPTPTKGTIAEKPVTQDEITNKYKPQFDYLQNIALSRLDTLYSTAKQEYVQGKKDGTLNTSALFQKYFQAGAMLEAGVDSQFNSTLNTMKAELIANNLPTDIVGVIKGDYEKAKSTKKSQLLAKVRN